MAVFSLQYGDSYYIAVSAVNAAGLVGTVKSQAIMIQHESQNLSPAKVAGIVVSCVLGTGIAVAALTIWITSRRYGALLSQSLWFLDSCLVCIQGRRHCPLLRAGRRYSIRRPHHVNMSRSHCSNAHEYICRPCMRCIAWSSAASECEL